MKRVVVIGGGTGLSNLLRGLKEVDNVELTAIVSVADDGGSTGKIRNEYKIPAVGDLRQVIISMAEKESIIESIMRYRFNNHDKNSSLHGHSLGNLILTALIDIEKDFYLGVEKITDVLNIKGQVLPITDFYDIALKATYTDGTTVIGESNIPNPNKKIAKVECVDEENIVANPIALDSIRKADVIIFGIGSLYTSVISNLVVPGVKKAILDNVDADIIYVCNIMTQPGETDNMTVKDHVKAIENYFGTEIIDKVVIHSSEIVSSCLRRYAKEASYPVEIDQKIEESHFEVFFANLLDSKATVVRHNPKKIRKVFEDIINKR